MASLPFRYWWDFYSDFFIDMRRYLFSCFCALLEIIRGTSNWLKDTRPFHALDEPTTRNPACLFDDLVSIWYCNQIERYLSLHELTISTQPSNHHPTSLCNFQIFAPILMESWHQLSHRSSVSHQLLFTGKSLAITINQRNNMLDQMLRWSAAAEMSSRTRNSTLCLPFKWWSLYIFPNIFGWSVLNSQISIPQLKVPLCVTFH